MLIKNQTSLSRWVKVVMALLPNTLMVKDKYKD